MYLMGVDGVYDLKVDIVTADHNTDGAKTKGTSRGWRPHGPEDITPAYLSKMSPLDVAQFSALRSRVLAESKYNWKQASDDFKARSFSSSSSLSQSASSCHL